MSNSYRCCTFTNWVIYVQNLRYNLLLVSWIETSDFSVSFDNGIGKLSKNGKIVAEGEV